MNTCWRIAIVDQTMATHCSQLSQRVQSGVPSSRSWRCIQQAACSAAATCSEGQALAAASMPLRKASCGCTDQSMAKLGVCVGQSQKISRHSAHMSAAQMP
jgi:hypothetical protein